jgi:hypothetical protein
VPVDKERRVPRRGSRLRKRIEDALRRERLVQQPLVWVIPPRSDSLGGLAEAAAGTSRKLTETCDLPTSRVRHSRTDAERLDMKALLYSATLAFLVSTPVFGADSVSLVGTWVGQRERIAKDEGRRGGLATLVITDQQGNTFAGRLKRTNSTGDEEEPLWGAFTPGAKLMMGADDEGTYIFSLIDENTLDYCYSEAGASARSVCARLTRQR